MKIHTDTNQQ